MTKVSTLSLLDVNALLNTSFELKLFDVFVDLFAPFNIQGFPQDISLVEAVESTETICGGNVAARYLHTLQMTTNLHRQKSKHYYSANTTPISSDVLGLS